jgi:hypothetical protein
VDSRLLAVLALLAPTAAATADAAFRDSLRASYERGLEFIAQGQLEAGEFPTYAWSATLGMERE